MEQQLAINMACTPEEVRNGMNYFITSTPLEGANTWSPGIANIICLNNKIIVRTQIDSLTDELQQNYQFVKGEWFVEYPNLKLLDGILSRYNLTIRSVTPYFIPDSRFIETSYRISNPQSNGDFEIGWFDEQEILQFQGGLFTEAVSFHPYCPDKIAVGLLDNQRVVALAGASEDSRYMWQIGINVLPQYQRTGVASFLVATIKQRLLDSGTIIPYYGTQISHVASVNTAYKAGFKLGWTEIAIKELT